MGNKGLLGISDLRIWINQIEIAGFPILKKFKDKNFIFNEKEILINKIVEIISFIFKGKIIFWGQNIIHDNIAPVIIDIGAIIINGISIFKMEGEEANRDLIIILKVNIVVRREYVTVIPTDEIIKIDINWMKCDFIIISKIISLEKNPDINGSPIRAIIEIPRDEDTIGEFFIIDPIDRISWYEEFIMIIPAVINIMDLNKAWVTKWKYAILGFDSDVINIIIAIWLRVE